MAKEFRLGIITFTQGVCWSLPFATLCPHCSLFSVLGFHLGLPNRKFQQEVRYSPDILSGRSLWASFSQGTKSTGFASFGLVPALSSHLFSLNLAIALFAASPGFLPCGSPALNLCK